MLCAFVRKIIQSQHSVVKNDILKIDRLIVAATKMVIIAAAVAVDFTFIT